MEIESRLTLGLTADAGRTQRRLLRAAGQIADAHPGVTIDEKPYGVALLLRGATATDAEHAALRRGRLRCDRHCSVASYAGSVSERSTDGLAIAIIGRSVDARRAVGARLALLM
jgi:hypothetical protein